MHERLIIDCHLHIGKVSNFFSNGYSAEQLLCSMDRLSIRAGCVSSMYAIGPDAETGNRELAEIISRYPDRLYGMLCVNPHYPEEIPGLIRMYMDTGLFRQFKLHPFLHSAEIDHEGYAEVWKYANDRRLSVLIHTWGRRDVRVFCSVATRYPEAVFIMGHAGGDVEGIREAVKQAKVLHNVLLDITSSWNYDGAVEYMAEHVGSDRVLFGSDAVYNSQSAALGRVLYSRLPEKDKDRILGLNMAELLRIPTEQSQ